MKSLQLVVRLISILFIILLILNLIGCAAIKIPATFVRPGEVNMVNFKEVVVYDVEGDKGEEITAELSQELVDTGRFKVLDRENFSKIEQEMVISESGNVDSDFAIELGKTHPALAIIVGRVSNAHCTQNLETTKTTDDNGKTNTINTLKAKATMTVSLKVIDTSTAELLATKRLSKSESDEKTGYNKVPSKIDDTPLYDVCVKQAVQDFVKAIAPHREKKSVILYNDKKDPDTSLGITYMYLEEYEKALEAFQSAVDELNSNPKYFRANIKKARALYNLGVGLEYTNKFDEAIEKFKEAFTLYRGNICFIDEVKDRCEEILVLHTKNVYLSEISFCETKKSEFDQLKEQEVF